MPLVWAMVAASFGACVINQSTWLRKRLTGALLDAHDAIMNESTTPITFIRNPSDARFHLQELPIDAIDGVFQRAAERYKEATISLDMAFMTAINEHYEALQIAAYEAARDAYNALDPDNDYDLDLA